MVDFEKTTKTSGNTTKVYKEESHTQSKSKFSMGEISFLTEIYKTKVSERINFVEHCVKNLQLFLTAMGLVLGVAIYSKVYMVLAVLPFLLFCMYLVYIFFVWTIFKIDVDCLRIASRINSLLNANLFDRDAEKPGLLKDILFYATKDYMSTSFRNFEVPLERWVIGGIYGISCAVVIYHSCAYFNNKLWIVAFLICLYLLLAAIVIITNYKADAYKKKTRKENEKFLN